MSNGGAPRALLQGSFEAEAPRKHTSNILTISNTRCPLKFKFQEPYSQRAVLRKLLHDHCFVVSACRM